MSADTWKWATANAGVWEKMNELNLLTDEHDVAWLEGAAWMAGGMAVCEFLSDLAAQVNACPDCYDGLAGVPWDRLSYMACDTCHGTGKRVTP